MIAQFKARVHAGTIHNRDAGLSRQGRWVEARDLPLQFLSLQGYDDPWHALHPHNVEGLVWDLDVNSWRNVKNASSHAYSIETLTYDGEDTRLFYR